ncbi:hypothetical protein [Geobacter sp. SVR]|uniref:hypothetical protein n=1 Tax=Geobacter sp. SVR TaxID=2495594 RepID=UPI00143EF554|nr:hypothetical protein [Geobacter sp. SVR]BCS53256.1 hypothetical protein GSVR_15640 [Geobacter sp. SVR]GCF84642.1 hypothetical protein GSbR_12420 [Geobacter sp. SVR]
MNGNAKLVMGGIVLSIAVVCLGGCSNSSKAEPEAKIAKSGAKQMAMAAQGEGKPAVAAAAQVGDQPSGAVAAKEDSKSAAGEAVTEISSISGKVVETMSVSNYSYVYLDNNGKKEWAAIPLGKIQVGAVMNLRPGMVMHDFHSKSLNRTFDRIVFSEGPMVTAQAQPVAHGGKQ